MGVAIDTLTLLLPERRRFSGQAFSADTARAMGRADRLADTEPGERAQLLRHFRLLPRGWPLAAITRQAEAGDAAFNTWLRADPVYVRPDMTGARLMAWGNLGLSAAEAEDFLKPLKPLFGDAGFPISATGPEHWFLMLPRESRLPEFSTPADGMGDDLFAHLPEGPEGRRWRTLLSEAQVTLHNHPRNAQRMAAGLPPVNSLWFWGGGILPDAVQCQAACAISNDSELQALAKLAGMSPQLLPGGNVLFDLRQQRDWPLLQRDRLEPALAALGNRYAGLLLDFADGARWRIERKQRWRFWRRPLNGFEA